MNAGDAAPEFELPDQGGVTRRLSDLLLRGPVVLFFYPAAMTAGCTKESCHFRDRAADFTAAGAQLVGISPDGVEKQARFARKHGFDYPLLCDTDRRVAGAFGVKRGRFSLSPVRRTTFVIDTDRTVLDVIASEINMNAHADRALTALRERTDRGP